LDDQGAEHASAGVHSGWPARDGVPTWPLKSRHRPRKSDIRLTRLVTSPFRREHVWVKYLVLPTCRKAARVHLMGFGPSSGTRSSSVNPCNALPVAVVLADGLRLLIILLPLGLSVFFGRGLRAAKSGRRRLRRADGGQLRHHDKAGDAGEVVTWKAL